MTFRRKEAFLICALGAYVLPSAAQTLGGCAMLPANNVWNSRIDQLPVDANSAAYINTIGASKGLHPDFSSTGYGIPYVIVPGTQPKVPVTFTYASESDPGPYPIPPNAPIEGGASSSGDRHVLVLENTHCILYELYAAYPQTGGSWTAGSGAVFDLGSNQLRPAGWTSADAAGLPILPGLLRYDEVAAGVINHAIRMTAPQTRNQYIWPARHQASSLTGSQYPPMGQRFRLKASFDVTPYSQDVQVILTALKKYGAILADNGSSWYLTGAPDSRWNDTTLHSLGQILGSNMEAVDESGLMTDPNSGAVSTTPTLSGVKLNPAEIVGGTSSTQNQIVLNAPAPAGGATVSLSSSNLALASVPASVLVTAGTATAVFPIRTSAVTSRTAVTIAATYLGVTDTAGLQLDPVSISSLSIAPASVIGGASTTGTITLNAPAGPGGVPVNIASSNSAASAPAAVTVPAGAISTTFTIATYSVTASTAVTFTASVAGAHQNAALTVNTSAPVRRHRRSLD